jgi:hypothetical protein
MQRREDGNACDARDERNVNRGGAARTGTATDCTQWHSVASLFAQSPICNNIL